MSKSPVKNVVKLQSAIYGQTRVIVTNLDIVQALLSVTQSEWCVRFTRKSLEVYRDRLNNWRICDQVIYEAISNREGTVEPQSYAYDAPPYRLKSYYDKYCALAIAVSLTPISYANFRQRAAEFPSKKKIELKRRRNERKQQY